MTHTRVATSGQRSELSGIVGWANQLHRLFGNDGPKISLPSLGHIIAPSAYPDATMKVGVGNLIIEVMAGWILVLLASGIYLWWPRAIEGGKPRLAVRWRKSGRLRWRDLHATTGILVSIVLICYIVSGLTWSRYWGENWRAVAATVTPAAEIDAPSTPAKVGTSIGWAGESPGRPRTMRCSPPRPRRRAVRGRPPWASPRSIGSPRTRRWCPLRDHSAVGQRGRRR